MLKHDFWDPIGMDQDVNIREGITACLFGFTAQGNRFFGKFLPPSERKCALPANATLLPGNTGWRMESRIAPLGTCKHKC
jgi:hypothetical protein